MGLIQKGTKTRRERIVIYGPGGVGKAQSIDAKILTPHGFVTMGDIEVGDEVIGSNGQATRVLGVFPQGKKPVFRVTMTDGASTECCDEHLWFTQTINESEGGVNPGRVRSLKEIRESLLHAPGRRDIPNHRIQIVSPVQFTEQQTALPLDPYVLGVYLGDGHAPRDKGEVRIHKPESDLITRVASRLPAGDEARANSSGDNFSICLISRTHGGTKLGRSSTRLALESMGLTGMGALNKFIPQPYLRASIEQRIDLLRGLCDTDGHVIHSGARVEYSTSSNRLSEDFIDLVRGLGGTVIAQLRTPHYSYLGERREGAPSWRLLAYFPSGIVPVSSDKHLAKWKTEQRKYHRSIEAIEEAGEKECVCIKVDAKDELYVTDDYILTHNTTFATQAPKPLVVNLNKGLTDDNIPRIGDEVKTWADLLKLLNDVMKDPDFAEIETVVLDTMNDAERLCIHHLLTVVGGKNHQPVSTLNDVGNGYGAGTNMLYDGMRQLYAIFEQMWEMGKRIIFIAHDKLENVKNPDGSDYQRYNMSVQDKIAALFVGNVDAVLFARIDVVVTKEFADKKRARALEGDGRILYTTEKAGHSAKNRYSLPEKMPLDWFVFVENCGADKSSVLKDSIRDLARTLAGLINNQAPVDYIEKALTDGSSHGRLIGLQNQYRLKIKEARAKLSEAAEATATEPVAAVSN